MHEFGGEMEPPWFTSTYYQLYGQSQKPTQIVIYSLLSLKIHETIIKISNLRKVFTLYLLLHFLTGLWRLRNGLLIY